MPHIVYTLDVVAIHPAIPQIEGDPRFDGFRQEFSQHVSAQSPLARAGQ